MTINARQTAKYLRLIIGSFDPSLPSTSHFFRSLFESGLRIKSKPEAETLDLDRLGDRPRRTAFRSALSPDVDILRLRTVTAGHDDEDVLRLICDRDHAIAGQLQVRPALYPLVESLVRHFTHAMTRALPKKLLNIGLAKTIACDDLRVFRANHHDRFRPRRSIHPAREIREYPFAFCAVEIRRANATIRADGRHGTCVRSKPALDVKRLPRTRFFVFGDAQGVFTRPTQCCLTSGSAKRTSDISLNKSNATADGCVGTPTFAENI